MAIAATLLFVFGVSLFGTTNLIPQMLQTLYGYRAIDAGLVLGPGALVITLLAPVCAQLLQRRIVSPKILLFMSMSIVGIAMFVYSSMNLDTNDSHYRWERMLQASGYGLARCDSRAPDDGRRAQFSIFGRAPLLPRLTEYIQDSNFLGGQFSASKIFVVHFDFPQRTLS